MAMERYLRDEWEKRCGGLDGFAGHDDCRSRWWNEWGDEATLAGQVVVAGTCIAATGAETAGASTTACVWGGRIIFGIEAAQAASDAGVFPGGKAPNWGDFAQAVGTEVALDGFSNVTGKVATGDEFGDLLVRTVAETPGLAEDLYSYATG